MSNELAEQVQLAASRSLEFMMAGNATVTLRSMRTTQRYTFKIKKAKENPKYPDTAWFVSYLTGPNNEDDYMPVGIINMRNGKPVFRLDRRSHLTVESAPVVAFMWTLRNLSEGNQTFGVEIFHSGTCGRCGRKLTVPESIQTGLGPECAIKGMGF